jgi:metacaspase-1
MRRLILAVSVIVLSNISGQTATAGDGIVNYYAVICGITHYQTAENTNFCATDAKEFRSALLLASNWKSENITLLVDSAATKDAIHTAIGDMANKADNDDVCLIFFSGHGAQGVDSYPYDESDGYDEYICPYESDNSPYNNIRDDEFGDWISVLPTNKYIILLNACYSGGQIKGKELNNGMAKIGPVKGLNGTQKGDGFAADLMRQAGTKDIDDNGRGIVITSSDDDELSWEVFSMRNGLFTYYLIEGLLSNPDTDRSNGISAQECFNYLSPRVSSFYLLTEPQTPQMYDAYGAALDFFILKPVIKKCTVSAGYTNNSDSISFSGKINPIINDFTNSTTFSVTFNSTDMNSAQTISFPVNSLTFKNNNYRYSGTENGIRKSFSYNSTTNTFAFSASKLDLTGMGCPIAVDFTIGGYSNQCDINEAMVNGKKPIPIVLKMNVINSLRVDKLTLKRGTTIPNSDQLTVKGGFSCQSVADSNFAANDFNVLVDSQQFTIPAGHFTADKKGERFKCTNYKIYDGPDLTAAIWADFNFKTGAYSLTIKNTDIESPTGTANLYMESGSFNANAAVTLP